MPMTDQTRRDLTIRTYKYAYATLTGLVFTRQCCALLLARSCWFSVTPLPDDQYLVATKNENHLEAIASVDNPVTYADRLPGERR